MIIKFKHLVLILSLSSYVIFLYSNPEASGVFDVRIPTYDNAGRISWELMAEEVDTIEEGVYLAKKPKMIFLESQQPATTAESNSGYFNIGRGKASGTENLFVQGQGFEAIGKSWTFDEDLPDARNRLAFSEQGKVGFESVVNSGFIAGKNQVSSETLKNGDLNKSRELDEYEFSKNFPTTALGDKIDLFDLGNGKRKVLLQSNVFIKMVDTEANTNVEKFSTMTCDWAEIYLGKDAKKTADSFGKISQIHALGDVNLNQPLRKSSAHELKWNDHSGKVELYGDAKVCHQEWGEARGEKIIIWEIDGRAEVIGGKQGRSRLLLPTMKNIKNN